MVIKFLIWQVLHELCICNLIPKILKEKEQKINKSCYIRFA